MQIKLDENLPADLVGDLAVLGHDADTVPEEGLAGCGDADVWRAAKARTGY
jgi:predicted nuclease of predicted toxin-antitoxin system